MKDTFWLKPAPRIYVAVLFVLICAAVVLSYFTLQSWSHKIQYDACERANHVRQESNDRIPQHVLDQENLLKLLTITTRTRALEAQAWRKIYNVLEVPQIGQSSHYYELGMTIKELIHIYDHASSIDSEIRNSERTIKYDYLVIVSCKKVT